MMVCFTVAAIISKVISDFTVIYARIPSSQINYYSRDCFILGALLGPYRMKVCYLILKWVYSELQLVSLRLPVSTITDLKSSAFPSIFKHQLSFTDIIYLSEILILY